LGLQGTAWLLERLYPTRFSKPEVQISLSNSFNQTVNALLITISSPEVREIEAQAEPVRASVRKMIEAYRPGTLGNGNGHRTVDIQAEPVGKPLEDLAPITIKADKPEFWFAFASGSGERPVSKDVAIYVAATIVNETVGRGIGNQAIVAFKSDPVTVSDVLAVIDRLCGGPAGWQHLQRKAGV
jgi:hypothetical protein